MSEDRPAILIIAVGNPSRGDDALGPCFAERLERRLAARGSPLEVEFQIEDQLQIEHALDLEGRERVLFVDASATAPPPLTLRPVAPGGEPPGPSTHALSPEALLGVARGLLSELPPCSVLAIRGERFELGAPLSPTAEAHLNAAVILAESWLLVRAGEACWRITLDGVVQGVGMRAWAWRRVSALGLSGRVANSGQGLELMASGPQERLIQVLQTLHDDLPPGAAITRVRIDDRNHLLPPGVHIAPSEAAEGAARLSLAPDLGTCDACGGDVQDPGRYQGYPLTSCAVCGPRFAIATALPWDRASTTLAGFPLCPACAAAYADPQDRRFHAQGVACATCGPPVWLAGPDGARIEEADPIGALARALRGGAIVAIQGVGAFHLACDATAPEVVRELRRRKRRETRPFAVMVKNLRAALALAELDREALDLLPSPARPIVLLPSRGELPEEVHPGTDRVGLMLPYTALHYMLLDHIDRPIILTSANESGQPPVIDPDQALRALQGVADLFLLHGRAIARRVEDSVVATGPLGPRIVRRARGYVPRPIRLARPAPEPLLAVGGHLKAAPAVVIDDLAFVGPHLGDLETKEAEDAFAEELEGLERLLGVRCAWVAADLHPDYATTHYAARRDGRRIGVQHHAAHVYSVLAESGLDEPVIGLALDGSGWGPDGTSWGAELLVVDGPRWRRLASARPLPLPGGERAIRQPWRAALGALWDCFGEETAEIMGELPVFSTVPTREREGVLAMLRSGTNTPGARGLGRWFDAFAALVLGIPRAGHEASAALALEEAARGEAEPFPLERPPELCLEGEFGPQHELDLRPWVRATLEDLRDEIPAAQISASFHESWARALSGMAARALSDCGLRRVVITGGATLNDRLSLGLVRRLGADRVLLPRALPPGDGGLSLGQAWAAILSEGGR